MNKVQMIHMERKEHWRKLIEQCDASGKPQQEWCAKNHVCMSSLSKWRRTIWREDEVWKELGQAYAANQESEEKTCAEKRAEENSFVEMNVGLSQAEPVAEVSIQKERTGSISQGKGTGRTKAISV